MTKRDKLFADLESAVDGYSRIEVTRTKHTRRFKLKGPRYVRIDVTQYSGRPYLEATNVHHADEFELLALVLSVVQAQ